MRRSYPSDITQEQFELIEDDLLSARKQTHPRKYSLYDVFCAVLYLLKEGCTWRAIPHDFPKWQNVRYHYEIWSKPNDDGISLFDRYSGPHVKDQKRSKERFGQKCKRPNHNPYISRGVIFPGKDVWGRSSL